MFLLSSKSPHEEKTVGEGVDKDMEKLRLSYTACGKLNGKLGQKNAHLPCDIAILLLGVYLVLVSVVLVS